MLIAVSLLILQTKSRPVRPASEVASVRRFVQRFYDWYSPRVGDDIGRYPELNYMMIALRTKRAMFTPELRHALAEDEALKDRHPGELYGLEFEPFLAGQDFPKYYKAGVARHKGKFWYVDVTGLQDKEWTGSNVPSLVVVVEKHKSQYGWRFTNFVYSDKNPDDNLLDILKEDRTEENN
jgi:hypothetical protein